MAEFTDLRARTWRMTLTIGKALKIKQRLGIDLLDVGDVKNSPLVRLADDPAMLIQIIWAMVNPDWPDRTEDEAAFWDAVDDQVLEAATAALTEALLAFFRPGRREVLRAALDLQNRMETRVAAELGKIDERAVDAAAGRLAGKVAAGLQTLGN